MITDRSGDRVSEQDRDIRVSDAERDAMVRTLGDHASVGRLTLDELDDRSSRALAAKTRGELDALTSDLPRDAEVAVPAAAQPAAQPRGRVRWLVSILSNSIHTARPQAVGTLNTISILGGGEIDLRNVEVEGSELAINSFSLLGSPDIFVPETIDVDTGGICVLGGIDQQGPPPRRPRPGAPTVRLHVFALLGGATLYRVPAELRDRPAREIRASLRKGQ
jgi:hypothetical protein